MPVTGPGGEMIENEIEEWMTHTAMNRNEICQPR